MRSCTSQTTSTATPTGPVNYLAYVPFELLFPWDGTWDSVPAAHAAAISFDLLTIVGLMLLGTTLRPGRAGRHLGLALAFAWAAYPFSLLALQENTNDLMVAAFLVLALAALRSPPGRGVLLGLAGAAKFAPLALAPLLARGTGEARVKPALVFGLACTAVCVAVTVPFIPDGGLRELYDTTIGFQLGRVSPFSLWALHPSLGWLQTALKLGAAGACRGSGVRAAEAGRAPGRRARRRRADRGPAARRALVLLLPRLDRAARAGDHHVRVSRPGRTDEPIAVDGWSRTAAARD